MVPAVSDRIPRVPPYSGCLVRAHPLPVQGCHLLRPAFPDRSGSFFALLPEAPTTPDVPRHVRFGLFPFRSPLLRNRCFFLLLQVLRCFSSLRSLRPLLPVTGLLPAGLPHSDTPGSLPACGSPGFFAACRVLHRLQKPRHPPSALIAFFRLFLLTLVFRLSPCEIVFSDLFFFYLVICFQYVNELPGSGPGRRILPRRPPTSSLLSLPDASGLQKGGVPATPSGTATLLRLSPSHRSCP